MLPSLLLSVLVMQAAPPTAEVKPATEKAAEKPPGKEEPPVDACHEIPVNGQSLQVSATLGMMPTRDAKGDMEAHMFFMAYTLDGVSETRRSPLMFSFTGGPGSDSVWLHLGALGPKRVVMQPDGQMPSPPFHLVDNEYTWLDETDLVFIDPVGTRY